jgi:hypothetical protein
MPTLELTEPTFECEIVSTSVLSVLGESVPAFLRAAHLLRSVLDPESLEVSADGPGVFEYELMLADGRHYRSVLTVATRGRSIDSSSFTLNELLAHNPIIEIVFDLLTKSATSIEVNWN